MHIYVVDHLPCLNNELRLCTGRSEQGVSPFGRTLAPYVRLDGSRYGPVSAVFSSALNRAKESADICFGSSGIPIVYDDRLTALDYGKLHDTPMEEIVNNQERYVRVPFPGGESYEDMALRFHSFLAETAPQFEGEQVVIIGHYATREILRHCCDSVPLEEVLRRDRPFQPRTKQDIAAYFAKADYKRFTYNSA